MQNLKFLLQDQKQLKSDAKNNKNYKNLAYYNQRLNSITQRIRQFGQRYNCIEVTVSYENSFSAYTNKIYYTDISEADAMDYTKSLIEVNFKVIHISAVSIPIGKLLAQ